MADTALLILTGAASILGILGINVKDKLTAQITDLNRELSQRQDDIHRLDAHITRLQKAEHDAADELEKRSVFVKETATHFSDLLTTTQTMQNSGLQTFLAAERQRAQDQIAAEIKHLDEFKTLLQKTTSAAKEATSAAGVAIQQTKDTNDKAQAALRDLETLPTVTFVMLRRDIPFSGQLPPEGPRVKIRLVHTTAGKEQNHAELTFEVNGEGPQPRILYEHHPERLEGTDYQMELLFAYDFPIFGKDVDFVMLKFWRAEKPAA